jgi:hypothetical protein
MARQIGGDQGRPGICSLTRLDCRTSKEPNKPGLAFICQRTNVPDDFYPVCTTLSIYAEGPMKPAPKKWIRVAVVENDPRRFVGFRALFDGD